MFNYKHHFRINFHLAFPVMLSQLGHVFVGVSDSIMVGWVGVVPLAGASVGNVIFHILLTFGIGISYGLTPLVAASDGSGKINDLVKYLNHSLIINLVTGILLCLLIFSSGNILHYLNQPEEVVKQAIPYLYVVTLSLIPLMIFQAFRQFMEGLSLTRIPMYISLFTNLLNIGLNYIFIFGKLGLEPMGLLGAGWASFIARVVMVLIIIIYFFSANRFQQISKKIKIGNYSLAPIKRILNIGFPAAVQYLFEVGAFSFAVIMIGWIGSQALAAHQIAINLASITYMMATGLAAAATIRVGNQLGKKDFVTMTNATNSLFIMVILLMACNGLIFIFGKDFFPTLYVEDLEVISTASGLLVIAALFQISDGVQVVALGGLRGLEDAKTPTLFVLIAYGVVGLPSGYLLAFPLQLGVKGVWIGLFMGLTTAAIGLFIRFKKIVKRTESRILKNSPAT